MAVKWWNLITHFDHNEWNYTHIHTYLYRNNELSEKLIGVVSQMSQFRCVKYLTMSKGAFTGDEWMREKNGY